MSELLTLLLMAGIALVFRWLTTLGSRDFDAEDEAPNEQRTERPSESDEERIRRFLEALGQPPGSKPPPPLQRHEPAEARPPKSKRVLPRPKPWTMQPLPPLTTVPPPMPVAAEAIQPSAVIAPPATVTLPPSVAPKVSSSLRSGPARLSLLSQTLHSSQNLRQLVLLREILGRPRGLQGVEELRSFSAVR